MLARRPIAVVLTLCAFALTVLSGSAAAASDDGTPGESVVELLLADRAELDRLVGTGVDLTHQLGVEGDRITAQVVVSPEELADLRAAGFEVGDVLFTQADARARLAERAATIERKRRANPTATGRSYSATADTDTILPLRADYFTSLGEQFINVEAKTSLGVPGSGSPTLTVAWDSGPGTEIGSGGSTTLSRFVDAGVYMYHRRQIEVAVRPSLIRITSSAGGSAQATIVDWLPTDEESGRNDPYFEDFVDHYMDPTELYDRIEQLHAEFPELSDIVEAPYRTNGYRRKAQALFGSSSSARVVVESLAWGHEGGNDLSVELRNPGAADSPLAVSAVGGLVLVSLGTDASGGLSSTAAQVVAAINASTGASSVIRAFTYRGSSGGGVVQAAAPTQLSDQLEAPATISREPYQVRLLRIGKHRDGSKPGVFVYAQEHAREWVPPLVAVEAAERLLRNYAHDGRTKQLLNTLDVFILPSVNPDGGHFSFYDDNGQRRNMTNHCGDADSDPSRYDDWGVDVNRNYAFGSLFDGYFGASTNCRDDVFAGPAELSEPESRNVAWVPDAFPNVRFSMNVHSSGNYFMWSPGAYKLAGRELLPRPDLGVETFFWGASTRILTEIKRHRGLSVTPARTGPIADVLYSAAGNSGDHMWYGHGIFAWNFEVGNQGFQPDWDEAHDQAMEFANGVVGLLDVAYAYDNDRQKPSTTISTRPNADGTVGLRFESSEAATVFYTLDGSRPTLASAKYAASGDREGPQTLTLSETTTVHWFSVDVAGNVEGNYQPGSAGENYRKATVTVG